MSTNKAEGGMSEDEALRASYWGEVLRILEQSDVALKTAGLREDGILRIEHNEARTAVSALIEREAAQAKRIAELESQTPSALREKLRSCEDAFHAAEKREAALIAERDALQDALYDIVDVAERYMTFAEGSRFGVAIESAKTALARAEARNG